MDQMELKYYYHIEASEPKSVNYQYIQYGVNSLRHRATYLFNIFIFCLVFTKKMLN